VYLLLKKYRLSSGSIQGVSKILGQTSRVLHIKTKENIYINVPRSEWFLSVIEKLHSICVPG
jgi:hypothetical protein